ncbi:MAG: TetR/AcrR family transcriptional regulator [Candidatus Sericytochromatia bacterium]
MSNSSENINTKNKIESLSKDMILTNGYNGFSYNDLSKSLGIKKASIHYYFSSKEELGLKFIKNFSEDIERAFDSFEKQKLNPKEKIESYLELFESFANSKTKICPTGMLSSELNNIPDKMYQELLVFFEKTESWLNKTISEGKNQKLFKDEIKENDFTLTIMSSIQGGLQIARLKKEPDIYINISSQLKKQLFI